MAVEITAECCVHYPEAKVTLISRSDILSSFKSSVSKMALEGLKLFKNLELILWRKVTLVEPGIVHYCDELKREESLSADVVFNCTGMVPNSNCFEEHMPDVLDVLRAVRVNTHFQVVSSTKKVHRNIFALGDVTNIVEIKLAKLALHHGDRVAKVIRALEAGTKLPRYKTVVEPLTISLGNDKAMLILNGHAIMCNKYMWIIKRRLEKKVRALLRSS